MKQQELPHYEQGVLFPQALPPTEYHRRLEAFRESLPEGERDETFRFFMVQWDIVQARFLIEQTNKPQGTLKVAPAAHAYGLAAPQTIDSPMYVDEGRAMSDAIDTGIPVILALIQGKEGTKPNPILIDGLHRLYKAYQEGKETIPCYALTPDEEQLCRV